MLPASSDTAPMYKAKPFQEVQHMVKAGVLIGKENKGRDFSGTPVTNIQADSLRAVTSES